MRPALLPLLLLSACATLPPPAGTDGTLRHYVRSNRDGSTPEHIVHFRPDATHVAVYKWVEKCETAAYVTAEMDPERWEPVALDAGKVAEDGSQKRFGRMVLDGPTRTVTADADLPPGHVHDTAAMPAGMPWFLFDYDLGDLNAHLQEVKPAADFTFAFALLWPEDMDDFLFPMATVTARHRGIEAHGGRKARRFDLTFSGARAGSGTLWTEPSTGAIVEAEASLPNHPGMTDFRLKLEREESGGQAAWERLLRGHYADCPA